MDTNEFAHGLRGVGFEVIELAERDGTQIRVTGRIARERMPTWRVVCELLNMRQGSEWSVDISQIYFVPDPLRELINSKREPLNGSHLRSAWRIIIQAKSDLVEHLGLVSRLLKAVQPAQVELTQVPLNTSPDRNAPVRGKGAQSVLTAAVGPNYRGPA